MATKRPRSNPLVCHGGIKSPFSSIPEAVTCETIFALTVIVYGSPPQARKSSPEAGSVVKVSVKCLIMVVSVTGWADAEATTAKTKPATIITNSTASFLLTAPSPSVKGRDSSALPQVDQRYHHSKHRVLAASAIWRIFVS